jgi:hypothetical protein
MMEFFIEHLVVAPAGRSQLMSLRRLRDDRASSLRPE